MPATQRCRRSYADRRVADIRYVRHRHVACAKFVHGDSMFLQHRAAGMVVVGVNVGAEVYDGARVGAMVMVSRRSAGVGLAGRGTVESWDEKSKEEVNFYKGNIVLSR